MTRDQTYAHHLSRSMLRHADAYDRLPYFFSDKYDLRMPLEALVPVEGGVA